MKKIILIISVVLILIVLAFLITNKLENRKNLISNEDGHIITYFRLSESSHNDMADASASKSYYFSLNENSLEIETTEIQPKIKIELEKPQREKLEKELLALIKTHSLKKWDGYDEYIDVLDDFHSFTLSVEYASGNEIYAHGDHRFPNNYDEVFEDVQSVFLNYENNE